MIHNDQELKGTQERIAYFCQLLAQFRVTASPENYPAMSSGYVAEIEKMQAEVLEYLRRHSSEAKPEAA